MLLLLGTALAGPLSGCERVFVTDELRMAAESAERAFEELDPVGFATARTDLFTRLACLGDPLSPADIARIHRVATLAAYFDGTPERVTAALAGALASELGFQIGDALVPPGHDIRQHLAVARDRVRENARAPLQALSSGWIEVNGAASPTVPADFAAVLQQIDTDGAVRETRYWWPGDPTDGFVEVAVEAPEVVEEPPPNPLLSARISLAGGWDLLPRDASADPAGSGPAWGLWATGRAGADGLGAIAEIGWVGLSFADGDRFAGRLQGLGLGLGLELQAERLRWGVVGSWATLSGDPTRAEASRAAIGLAGARLGGGALVVGYPAWEIGPVQLGIEARVGAWTELTRALPWALVGLGIGS